MEGIYNATDEFPFSKLLLLKPTVLAGGNYFIKFRINELPLYIQTPKCNTKQGILKAGKKYFSDLMFTNEHESFIQWIEKLENYSQKYIYDHRETWFDTELDLHDIENSFSSCVKLYKSGKYYLVRTHVPTQLGKCSLKIYNENEELVDPEEINDKNNIITILEFQGIKCSARSFQIEIEIKQMLVLPNNNLFEKCILVKGKPKYDEPDTSITKIGAGSVENRGLSGGLSGGLSEDNSSVKNNDYLGKTPTNTMVIDTSDISVSNDILQSSMPVLLAGTAPVFSQNTEMVIKTNHSIDESERLEQGEDDMDDGTADEVMADDGTADELKEIELSLDEIPENEQIQIKTRNDVYYKMYQDAKKKAKLAKDLALSAYLEAKQIKNKYMLDDILDSSSDESEDEESETDTF